MSVCISMWAMSEKFFQSLPVRCGASPDVTDSREKRNQGQSDFLVDQKKNIQTLDSLEFILFYFFVLTKTTFFSFSYCPSQLRGWMKCPSSLMTRRILGKLIFFQLLSVPIKGMDEMSIQLDNHKIIIIIKNT